MTHNPAAAHPRLLALIEGMEKIEQAASKAPWHRLHDPTPTDPTPANPQCKCAQVWGGECWDGGTEPVAHCETFEVEIGFKGEQAMHNAALIALSRNALPPLLAFLRAQAEEAAAGWQHMDTAVTHWRREIEMLSHGPDGGDETIYPPRPYRSDEVEKPATAHHACCTTALAAAAGTPALALLAGELQNMMEGM